MQKAKVRVVLRSLEETNRFGYSLGQVAEPDDLICLDGDLGAGKTTLAQAIAAGLKVPESCYVTSPSFAIFHEYPGRIPMYHMDFYRLGSAEEVVELGFDEYFFQGGLSVVEWSVMADGYLPDTGLHVSLSVGENDHRIASCEYCPGTWHDKLQRVLQLSQLRQD